MEKRGDQLYNFVHLDLHLGNIIIKSNDDIALIDNGSSLYKGLQGNDQSQDLDLGGSPIVDLFYFTSWCLNLGANNKSLKSLLDTFYIAYFKQLSSSHAATLVDIFQSQIFSELILQNIKKSNKIVDLNYPYHLYVRLRQPILWNIEKEVIISAYNKIHGNKIY